jgi:Leucine-rich repeat (LRR) protein
LKRDNRLEHLISKINANRISKENASEVIISLFSGTNDLDFQYNCLKILKNILTISRKNFTFLENLLISDEDPNIKCMSAEILIEKFPEKCLDSLEWELEHEKSPIVLQKLFSLINHSTIQKINKLCFTVNEWLSDFGQRLKIEPSEAKFILDLETLFAKKGNALKNLSQDTYKFYSVLSQLENNQHWFLVKEHHLIELKFNYFKWKFLKEYHGKTESLKKYKDLDLLLSLLIQMKGEHRDSIQIPASISNLTYLEKLDISENNLKSLPSSMENLNSLIILDLSGNLFKSVPKALFSLKNLKKLDLSYNKLQKIPSSLINLKKLEEINITGNKIKESPELIKDIIKNDS